MHSAGAATTSSSIPPAAAPSGAGRAGYLPAAFGGGSAEA